MHRTAKRKSVENSRRAESESGWFDRAQTVEASSQVGAQEQIEKAVEAAKRKMSLTSRIARAAGPVQSKYSPGAFQPTIMRTTLVRVHEERVECDHIHSLKFLAHRFANRIQRTAPDLPRYAS
jgi:hypothetical protein